MKSAQVQKKSERSSQSDTNKTAGTKAISMPAVPVLQNKNTAQKKEQGTEEELPAQAKLKSAQNEQAIQRRIDGAKMPSARIPAQMATLSAYLSNPVGTAGEFFLDEAQHADTMATTLKETANYTTRYNALLGTQSVSGFQALANDINAMYDRAIADALAIRTDELNDASQGSLLDIWQRQLRTATGENVRLILGRINALSVTRAETPSYDTSWKTNAMTEQIEVDSGGAVVGATISIPKSIITPATRRRLTVSKERHMYDYFKADTAEPSNSLIAKGAELSSVEADIMEIATDFRKKFIAGTHKAKYTFVTASGRSYTINKTEAEYPHSFPIAGPDVVAMNDTAYNFLLSVKTRWGGKDKDAQTRTAKQLCTGIDATTVRTYIELMRTLKVSTAVIDSFTRSLEPEVKRESARSGGKAKRTKPRSGPGKKKAFNE